MSSPRATKGGQPNIRLWRIATETRAFLATDLSGAGAARHPGRWNDEGDPVVYTAQTISLAALETAAYVDPAGLPLNRFLIEIRVPARVWVRRETLDPAQLDPRWASIPAGRTSVAIGSAWLKSQRSALLLVPSVVVPEESAVLINPRHPDAAALTASVIRRFEYNMLFRR